MKRIIFIFSFFFSLLQANSQSWMDKDTTDNNLVQFSGIIVTSDSLKPVPFVNIIDRTTRRGTTSDYFGFFSFVAQKGDSIVFSALGFKKSLVVIPDTLTLDRYSLIQMMQNDTIILAPAHIFPWPSRSEFERAFVNLELKQDEMMARAERNMRLADMKEAAMTMNNDANMAFKQSMKKEYSKMYYAGQVPVSNLLNPIAWAQFVQAWKRGDFKRE